MRLVIGLVGRKGSGKGTVAKILKEAYGAAVFRYSDQLRDILTRLSVAHTRENLVALSEAVRQAFGQDALQRALVADVQKAESPVIVIEGIRRLQDLDGLERLGNFVLANISVPLETRYERLKTRVENADEFGSTLEDFKRLEHASTEVTIGDVEARATKTIDNSGSYDDLVQRIDELMGGLR